VIGGFEADLWGELGLGATVPAVLQNPPFSEQLVLELQHGHLNNNSTPRKPMT
jgi:hypothetical protein